MMFSYKLFTLGKSIALSCTTVGHVVLSLHSKAAANLLHSLHCSRPITGDSASYENNIFQHVGQTVKQSVTQVIDREIHLHPQLYQCMPALCGQLNWRLQEIN